MNENYEQDYGIGKFVFVAKVQNEHTKSGTETVEFTIELDADYDFSVARGRAVFAVLFPKLKVEQVLRCGRIT